MDRRDGLSVGGEFREREKKADRHPHREARTETVRQRADQEQMGNGGLPVERKC